MITTDKFVYVHMHKTGGQSLGNVIETCIPGARAVGYHFPYEMLPAEFSDLPVVGMVRNPWDWYVSWYAFNTRLIKEQPHSVNPLFFILSDGHQADFSETVTNLIKLGSDQAESAHYRKALIEILPDKLEGNAGVGLTKDSIRSLAEPERGYYSWQFERMHGDLNNPNLHIGRFEDLQHDFLSIMRELEVAQTDAMEQRFDAISRRNTSRHSHYSRYYDDELRELVASREKTLIDRFGYRFETDDSGDDRIEFPNIQIGGRNDSFRKLSGKASNFLKLKDSIDVDMIRRKLSRIPERMWHTSGREQAYEAHKQTNSLLLVADKDFRHYNPTEHELYHEFRKELKPVTDFIAEHYNHDGYVVRILFARLAAGGKIAPHTDGLYSLMKCHRIHLPIVSNDQVVFSVGGEDLVMREGELWEINNSTLHAVENRSDKDRIHLIIDWVPNSTVRPEDKRPPRPPAAARASATPTYNGRAVGRNQPCPCNSGKKFKHCCGAPR